MDDAHYGVGPVLIQAARDGHRVVIVTVVSDFTTWGPTVGREAKVRGRLIALAERWGCEQVFLDYAYHRVEADVVLKERIAAVLQDVAADVVFVHNTEDHWPDHRAAGEAGKDAAIFRHGLTGNLDAPRTPLVFAFNLTSSQTIRFEPDSFIDVTAQMPEYMEMLGEADGCLKGRPVEELWWREIVVLAPQFQNEPAKLRVSNHGWRRLAQCSMWGEKCRVAYALGLKTLWSWPDEAGTREWFRRTWPNLR